MADNFNWGKSMTSDEVRNAAENLWRVENYRNRMPDRTLENNRLRMAEADARQKEKQQNEKISMLENKLKDATDAINKLAASNNSATSNYITPTYTGREDTLTTVEYYKEEIQKINNDYKNSLKAYDDIITNAERNCSEKIVDNLTSFIDKNVESWDYSSLKRSYKDIHLVAEKFNFKKSIEDYISTRSNTMSCDDIKENISKSDIKIMYTYFSNYLRQYMGDYFEKHYEELNIIDRTKFNDYIIDTFPCIDIEDFPVYAFITIIFAHINDKYCDIEKAMKSKDNCINGYEKRIKYDEDTLYTHLKQNDDREISERILQETQAKYKAFSETIVAEYKANHPAEKRPNTLFGTGKGTNSSNKVIENVTAIAFICFIIWIGYKIVSYII